MRPNALLGCKLLILEDDFFQAADYQNFLTDLGAEIVIMTADLKRLPQDLQGSVDVALLDINLRGADSYEFARALRRQAVPFLFVTGYEREQLPPDLAETHILTKPFALEELVWRIWAVRRGYFPDTFNV